MKQINDLIYIADYTCLIELVSFTSSSVLTQMLNYINQNMNNVYKINITCKGGAKSQNEEKSLIFERPLGIYDHFSPAGLSL